MSSPPPAAAPLFERQRAVSSNTVCVLYFLLDLFVVWGVVEFVTAIFWKFSLVAFDLPGKCRNFHRLMLPIQREYALWLQTCSKSMFPALHFQYVTKIRNPLSIDWSLMRRFVEISDPILNLWAREWWLICPFRESGARVVAGQFRIARVLLEDEASFRFLLFWTANSRLQWCGRGIRTWEDADMLKKDMICYRYANGNAYAHTCMHGCMIINTYIDLNLSTLQCLRTCACT